MAHDSTLPVESEDSTPGLDSKELGHYLDWSGLEARAARLMALQDASEICLERAESMSLGMRKLEAEACAIAIFRTARELSGALRTDISWNRKLVLLVETGDSSEPEGAA